MKYVQSLVWLCLLQSIFVFTSDSNKKVRAGRLGMISLFRQSDDSEQGLSTSVDHATSSTTTGGQVSSIQGTDNPSSKQADQQQQMPCAPILRPCKNLDDLPEMESLSLDATKKLAGTKASRLRQVTQESKDLDNNQNDQLPPNMSGLMVLGSVMQQPGFGQMPDVGE